MVGDKIGIGSNYKWPIFEIKGISLRKNSCINWKKLFCLWIKESKVRAGNWL